MNFNPILLQNVSASKHKPVLLHKMQLLRFHFWEHHFQRKGQTSIFFSFFSFSQRPTSVLNELLCVSTQNHRRLSDAPKHTGDICFLHLNSFNSSKLSWPSWHHTHTYTSMQKNVTRTHTKFGTPPQQPGRELKSKVTRVGHCTCWLPSSPSPFYPQVMPSAAPVHPGDYWGPGIRWITLAIPTRTHRRTLLHAHLDEHA